MRFETMKCLLVGRPAVYVLLLLSWPVSCGTAVSAQGPAVQVIRLNETHNVATPPTANNAVASPLLSSGASVDQVELANTRDILLDVRRARGAAANLYGEVTRHPITGYTSADAMGPVMVEIPMPTFDMSEVLPARKAWVDLYVGEISSTVSYIKNDIAALKGGQGALPIPSNDRETFENDLQDCTATIERAVNYASQLKTLTASQPYDNLAIAKLISPLHKDLTEVEKTTKKLIGQIRKNH